MSQYNFSTLGSMDILTQILTFLFVIFILVTIHEFAHFSVAKYFGVKTLRFSLGFGKALWRWYGKDGTEYVIALLPLGGYVKLLDEREGDVASHEKHLAFNRKPLWIRTLVLFAGPMSNWLLAIVLLWIVFVVGIEQSKPVIGKVLPNSIAAAAGLKPGDELLEINSFATPNWQKAMMAIVYQMGETGTMSVTALSVNTQTPQHYSLNLAQWQVGGLAPDPIESLGIVPYRPQVAPIITQVMPNSAAAHAELQAGDQIVAMNNQPVTDWIDFIEYVQKHPNQTITLKILRNKTPQTIKLIVGAKYIFPYKKIGFIGVQTNPPPWPANMKYEKKYSVFSAWQPAMNETITFSAFNFVVLGKMLMGHISLQGLGGPITIFTTANQAFKQGVSVYLSFLAIMSIMLACLNILPIPGLDGGHLLYFLIEAIRGKPVSVAAQVLAWRLGMILLILIMVQATINDVMRLL